MSLFMRHGALPLHYLQSLGTDGTVSTVQPSPRVKIHRLTKSGRVIRDGEEMAARRCPYPADPDL
jgi:hypothetical protein